MVELRKRKTPPPAPAPSAKKAKPSGGAAGKLAKAKAAITKTLKGGKSAGKANGEAEAPAAPPAVGDVLTLEGFGGEVETHDGVTTDLKKLVEESKEGVVLFTYPKASTPGCTTQVCLFRDSYTSLTSTGLSIYGLSNDSPKANTTFKTKQNLPYLLLCNPSGSLITAIGLGKGGGKTTRGVFVIDKKGKVLAAEPGGPAATMAVVKRLVDEKGTATATEPVAAAGVSAEKNEKALPPVPDAAGDAATLEQKKSEDKQKADVADEVADTAAKLDA